MIYLDNAATTWPKPQSVRNAVQQGMSRLGANPGRGGYEMSMATAEAVYSTRRELAEFFGARDPACVSFQASCTQAMNIVLKSVLKSGDHVVCSDLEHNAVMRPLEKLKERGVSYTVAETFPGDSVATMDSFRHAMRENTKLVVCTHASNVWGIRLPVERIAALAHQYGAKFCLDAAQGAGLLPIDLEDSGIDYACCAGHKGLYGPMGTGLLLIRDPEEVLDTLLEGGTGSNSRSLVQPEESPDRYESGTLNVPGILGIRAGLSFVRSRSPERLWQQEIKLLGRLYDRLASTRGVKLFTDRPEQPWFVPVLSFQVEGVPAEEMGERLARRGIALRCGLHCAPLAHEKFGTLEQGTLRVAPSAFTTAAEIDSFARTLSGVLRG